MLQKTRKLKYNFAINEAIHQIMEINDSVFLVCPQTKRSFEITFGLLERFGDERIIDSTLFEKAITGAVIGSAFVGMRPIIVHPKIDSMMYACKLFFDQTLNKYYKNYDKPSAPLFILRTDDEEFAQYSHTIYAQLVHNPESNIFLPSTPYDAKGFIFSALKNVYPSIFIDNYRLHNIESEVPEEPYEIPMGKGIIRKEGDNVTVITFSHLVHVALEIANSLKEDGIKIEVIDLRSLKPIDINLLFDSVKKTGRVVIADGCMETLGVGVEIWALICENCNKDLKAPIMRVALPELLIPPNDLLLKENYYIIKEYIIQAVKKVLAT